MGAIKLRAMAIAIVVILTSHAGLSRAETELHFGQEWCRFWCTLKCAFMRYKVACILDCMIRCLHRSPVVDSYSIDCLAARCPVANSGTKDAEECAMKFLEDCKKESSRDPPSKS